MVIAIYLLCYILAGGFTSLHASSDSPERERKGIADSRRKKGIRSLRTSDSALYDGSSPLLHNIASSPSPARSSPPTSNERDDTSYPSENKVFEQQPGFTELPPPFSISWGERVEGSHVVTSLPPRKSPLSIKHSLSPAMRSPSPLSNNNKSASSNSPLSSSPPSVATSSAASINNELETIHELSPHAKRQRSVQLIKKELKNARNAAVDLFQNIIICSKQSTTLDKVQAELYNLFDCWCDLYPFSSNDAYQKSLQNVKELYEETKKQENVLAYLQTIFPVHVSLKNYNELLTLLEQLTQQPNNKNIPENLCDVILRMKESVQDFYLKEQYGEEDKENLCKRCQRGWLTISRVEGKYVHTCRACSDEEFLE